MMRRLGVLLACVLVCAGCSSSDNPIGKTMQSVLLQLSDFPPSWRAFPPPSGQNDLLGELAKCTGVALSGSSIATVHSSEFRHGGQRITSTAVGYDSNHEASLRGDSLGNPRADGCMAKEVHDRVLEALPDATITSSKFTVQSGGVNVAVNWVGSANGTVTVADKGQHKTVYISTVFLYGRSFYCDVTFLGVDRPVSDIVQTTLIDNVAQRAQHT
jgi:hypothetical protein